MTVSPHHIASLTLDQVVALGAMSAAAGRSLHDRQGFLYADAAGELGLAR